jgi:hypothetical protein
MLEYEITNMDLAISTLTDPILLAVTIFVYLVLGVCFLKTQLKKARIVILLFLILLPILYLLPVLIKASSGWDWYGYKYDGKLHIRAWPVDEVVDLNNSEVFLTKSEKWMPELRMFGFGTKEIGMGYFKLKNGVKAVVFRHKNSDEFVVINSSGKYYVLIHPGVEELYREIKDREIKDKGFKVLKVER